MLDRNLSREPYPLETSLPGVFAAGDVRTGSINLETDLGPLGHTGFAGLRKPRGSE